MDLTPGSPAQVQFIQPVISKLGVDPFEVDVDTFITDRFRQEFPDLYAGDPSAIRDLFIKPLILILEPFRREVNAIALNQSIKNPTVLSDDDADALAANFFVTRNRGGLAKGVARLYFPNPTTAQITINTRFYTSSGLNFFPSTPITITAEDIVFNRSNSLYYLDVTIQSSTQETASMNTP